MLKVVVLGIIQAAFLATGQIFLKLAMDRIPSFHLSWSWFTCILKNPWLALMGFCFTVAGLLWLYMLRRFPFSVAYPVTSIAYVFGVLAAVFVFHEQVAFVRWSGVFLIIAGVFLVTVQGNAQERMLASLDKQKKVEACIANAAKAMSSMVCDFQQIKYSSLLEDAAVSKGRMYYKTEVSAEHRENDLKQSVLLRWEYEDGLVLIFSQGQTQVIFQNGQTGNTLKTNRFFKEIIYTVLYAVNGETVVDPAKFSATFYIDAANYYMVLVPVQKELKNWISSIELVFDLADYSGKRISITDKSGDRTVIELLNKQTEVAISPEKFSIK